jgi:hypothetical protein
LQVQDMEEDSSEEEDEEEEEQQVSFCHNSKFRGRKLTKKLNGDLQYRTKEFSVSWNNGQK